MRVEGRINVDGASGTFFIEKNNQNVLKGLAWTLAGTACVSPALGLTILAVQSIAVTTLTGAASFSSFPPSQISLIFPAGFAAFTGLTVAVNYVALKVMGYCFKNMNYHFGPEYSIVKQDLVF